MKRLTKLEYIPVVTDLDADFTLENITVLHGQKSFEDAVDYAARYCLDKASEELGQVLTLDENFDGYDDEENTRADMKKLTLHFSMEVDDDEHESGRGWSPWDKTCYIFKVKE